MNHIQINITVEEPEQEQLVAALAPYEATGFEQTDTELIAYFEEGMFRSYEINEVLKNYSFRINTVAEKNWNEAWEKDFSPVVIDGFCSIRAHFHAPVPDIPFEIIITPKMSFGTGHHATTHMMVEQMKQITFTRLQVFDFGTGTGVLAILAEKMGAAAVMAIDNDSWSITNAQENMLMNQCARIELLQSSVVPPGKSFDVVLANINKNVILENLAGLKKAVAAGGKILLSGLMQEDEQDVLGATSGLSLSLVCKMERNNWISLLLSDE